MFTVSVVCALVRYVCVFSLLFILSPHSPLPQTFQRSQPPQLQTFPWRCLATTLCVHLSLRMVGQPTRIVLKSTPTPLVCSCFLHFLLNLSNYIITPSLIPHPHSHPLIPIPIPSFPLPHPHPLIPIASSFPLQLLLPYLPTLPYLAYPLSSFFSPPNRVPVGKPLLLPSAPPICTCTQPERGSPTCHHWKGRGQ